MVKWPRVTRQMEIRTIMALGDDTIAAKSSSAYHLLTAGVQLSHKSGRTVVWRLRWLTSQFFHRSVQMTTCDERMRGKCAVVSV